MLKINGTLIKYPTEFQVDIADIVNATRNASATMNIDKIATKRKLTCSWGPLTNTEISTLLTAASASVFFTVDYPDPLTGANRSSTFYVGDRSAPVCYYINGTPFWKGLKMNFIEQ